ncbi:fimbria/pilus outer membrane usher protein [Kalamiella sp. sgz302252]|uniref:fimbria/pilus outer membrane usher protein n=1 Tax=Pantoea sp. sgz302252 TaxID=3341827 RepID=UPI0036D3CD3A
MSLRNKFFLTISHFILFLSFNALATGEVNSGETTSGEQGKVRFNTAFLTEFNKDIDLSWLEKGEGIKPGMHRVDIYINGDKLRSYNVNFIKEGDSVIPCIPASVLQHIGLDEKKLPLNWKESICIDIAQKVKGAEAKYDYDSESLKITIPQVYFLQQIAGFIDPSRWDEGINAFSANYSLNGSKSYYRGTEYGTYYGDLKTLWRLGAWRLATFETLSGGGNQKSQLQHLQAYAQRAIGSGLSELSVGDFNTRGSLFDTLALRGAVLQSDERMLPWTARNYAPQITGIANSNAVVTVTQNNNIIYEKNVPPGEFSIRDLNAAGYGGDLEVTIKESNGTVRKFKVPYSSLPQLLRKGYFNYSLAAGELRYARGGERPGVVEATARYGLSDFLTLYSGGQLTWDSSYLSLSSGAAFNTPLGAISTEFFQSVTAGDIQKESGKIADSSQIKVGLSKQLSETQTFLNLSGYHHLGKNFYTLNDYLQKKEEQKNSYRMQGAGTYRNRLEVTLAQKLAPNWGEVSLSGWWEKNNTNPQQGSRSSWIMGYRNSYSYVNYSLNVNRTFTAEGHKETEIFASLSVPLGYMKKLPPSLRASMSYTSNEARFRTSVNGSHQGEDYSSSFNSYFSQSSKKQSDFGINVGHTGSVLQKSIAYSQGMQHHTFSGSLAGALLIHSEGIHFSSYLSDTVALVKAPGGEGATISGNRFSRINKDGYGLLPNLSPYEENKIFLDTKGSSLGFDPGDDEPVVVPTAGAVIKVNYTTNNTTALLVRIKNSQGRPLPFGSRLVDTQGNISGTVGQSGITILSLMDSDQPLTASWKLGKKVKDCVIPSKFIKQAINISTGKTSLTLICRETEK